MRAALLAIVFALGVALAYWPLAAPLDHAMLDAQFRFLRAHALRAVDKDVVIVGIDDETTHAFPEPLTLWHVHLGRFLRAVADTEATAIALDVVLPDRSFDAIVPGYDRELLAGIVLARRTKPLVLALTVDPSGQPRPVYPAVVAAAGPGATGYALLPIDSDGIVRRFDERLGADGSAVPTLSGNVARKLGREVRAGFIDYAAGDRFAYLPLSKVLERYDAGDRRALADAFDGKVVLLGGVFRFEDRLAAPVNLASWDSGASDNPAVLLHAQVLRNLLDGGLIAPISPWIVALLTIPMTLCWFVASSPVRAAAVAVAGSALVIVTATWLLSRGAYLPSAALLLTLAAAVGARASFDTSLKLRERLRLRHAFGAYVSPRILQQILRSNPRPGLGGERYRLCVLFADIRGFTERSERMAPEHVVTLLNRYFSEVTASIHEAGGTVDKFLGDGIMAFFGAPQRLDNPCVPAFRAARDMLQRVRRLNAALTQQGEAPIAIGIALHVGDAVVGNIGSRERHNYTAVGDTVNVASRLESLTVEVGCPLVCSVDVFEMLEDRGEFVKLGSRPIKGHRPVDICGWRPEDPTSSDRESGRTP
jgi:adenylate cyclase